MSASVCGYMAIELRLAENHSLKGKRQVMKRLKDRLRNRFNVAVAELDHLDNWQQAVLGVTTISNDKTVVERTLAKALQFVDEMHLAEIIDSHVELW